MQRIYINSWAHYKIEEREGRMCLLKFPEECPSMGERKAFRDDEGKCVASWEIGEVVEFVCGVVFTSPGPTSEIVCGDDIRYHLEDWRL